MVVLGLVAPLVASVLEVRATHGVKANDEASAVSGMGAVLPYAAMACLLLAAVAFRVVMFSLGSSLISFGF